MPIYEYVCHDCGNEFEMIVRWSDSTPTCTSCHSANVGRELSPPAIHFKGSGWYITDSKKGQKAKNGANGVSGTNGSGKDGEEKSEAKESTSESSSTSKGDSKASKSDSKSDSSAKEPAKASS